MPTRLSLPFSATLLLGSKSQDEPATEIEERKKSFLNSPKFGFHPVL